MWRTPPYVEKNRLRNLLQLLADESALTRCAREAQGTALRRTARICYRCDGVVVENSVSWERANGAPADPAPIHKSIMVQMPHRGSSWSSGTPWRRLSCGISGRRSLCRCRRLTRVFGWSMSVLVLLEKNRTFNSVGYGRHRYDMTHVLSSPLLRHYKSHNATSESQGHFPALGRFSFQNRSVPFKAGSAAGDFFL